MILRKPILEVTLVCLLILLLAQSLIGILSFSALNRLISDTTAKRAEVTAQRAVSSIENGLRLGKSLAQYFGLVETFKESIDPLKDILGASIVLNNGDVIKIQGKIEEEHLNIINIVNSNKTHNLPNIIVRRSSDSLMIIFQESIILAKSLHDTQKQNSGILVLSIEKDNLADRTIIVENLQFLLKVTALVSVALVVIFRYLVPIKILYKSKRNVFLIPLLALMLAQGIYSIRTISTFRTAWMNVIHHDVEILAKGLQKDLNRILNYGIKASNLRDVELVFSRLIKNFPIIEEIELIDQNGVILNRADAAGALSTDVSLITNNKIKTDKDHNFKKVLPLGKINNLKSEQGSLVLHLSPSVIGSEVRGCAMNAMTVSIVALITVGEMLLLLSLLVNRTFSNYEKKQKLILENSNEIGHVARPVMFGYFFSWALPLGFLPLYARSLPTGGIYMPSNLMLAMPISVEMACSFLTTLIAGKLTDKKGWQVPVLLGLIMTFLGMIASSVVNNLIWFSGARD
ncbi:MAG: hypothetical protein IR526_00230 [Bordetella sp.]|nr:MAG: hypothetical protein IR526_00230 [Bordetella sp.]